MFVLMCQCRKLSFHPNTELLGLLGFLTRIHALCMGLLSCVFVGLSDLL